MSASDSAAPQFDRNIAFSRTIGFVTEDELEVLKRTTVAIAGLGGVGGSHVLTLARLGIGGLHIADMDSFGMENFNRQAGASMKTLGQPKLEVMKAMALAINPEMRIQTFPKGIHADNMDEFLKGVDVYADALDFFEFKTRGLVFSKCEEKKIPAITVGPIGMGAALLTFLPGGMKFQEYFQWQETDGDLERGVKFLVGLSPKLPHRHYVVDQGAVKLDIKKGPSTPMACELCAGVMGTEILKLVMKRGKVLSAPHSILFDAFHNRVFHNYVWLGNRNPIQQLKIHFIQSKIRKSLKPKG